MTLIAVLVLAVATYAFRVSGVLLRDRISISDDTQRWLTLPTVALLAALIATATLYEADEFGGWARVTGVAVGALAAVRRWPFILV
ncbi:MAG: AzlD domain-containing protein, partial [Micromonosporaceae bacterium]